jgi:hypothetical protein
VTRGRSPCFREPPAPAGGGSTHPRSIIMEVVWPENLRVKIHFLCVIYKEVYKFRLAFCCLTSYSLINAGGRMINVVVCSDAQD